MRPRLLGLSFLAAALAIAAVSSIAGSHLSLLSSRGSQSGESRTEQSAILSVPAADLDLGEIWDRSWVQTTIPVTNLSRERVMCKFSGSCNCMSIEPSSLSLDGGQTTSMGVTIKLAKLEHFVAAPIRVVLVGDVEVEGAHRGLCRWEIKGTSRANLSFPRDLPDFGRELHVHGQAVSRTFEVESAQALQRLDIRHAAGWVEGKAISVDDSGKRFKVELTATKLLLNAARELDSPVEFIPVSAAGGMLPLVEIPVHFSVRHDVEAVPGELSLGVCDVGETAIGQIRIVSCRSLPFRTQAICRSLTEILVEANNEGENVAFTVKLPVDRIGLTRGKVEFSISDDVEEDSYTITVPVSVVAVGNPP